jgi:seryl-tRNA synthetase
MLDIKVIRTRTEDVKRAAQVKGCHVDIDRILELDAQRRDFLHQSEQMRARRNSLSRSIPKLSNEERPGAIAEVKEIKTKLGTMETELAAVQAEYDDLMLLVPIIPHVDSPIGMTEDENVVLRTWGTPREFDFEPRDHEDLGKMLDIIDKDRAIAFAGGRSYILRGAGAMLDLAVMRLALDIVIERGFTPILGPLMVNEVALMGTGFFPHGKEDVYHLEKDDKWLIGTSEVQLVAMHMNETMDGATLPLMYTGYSPCFRREAGSHGRDTRGVYRVHQFNKVEQVIICAADEEENDKHHDFLVENAERVLRALELPHRVSAACTGEMGQGKYKMYEVETWMPSRKAYSETHSCSSLQDFQSRRLNIKYKDEDGKTRLAWTLNNTAAASPRILIPLLETHQNADGSVDLPEALHKYMYGITRLEPVK